jgi:uncharacterized phiE125 gp8 family phage protein
MPTNGYLTVAEMKARLDLTGTAHDAVLDSMITAASRQVDAYTGRTFFTTTGDRYLTAIWPDYLILPYDAVAITAIATDNDGDRVYEMAWASTDYDLEPEDAPARGEPYVAIRVSPSSTRLFPVRVARGVRITGTWGYASSVPAPVIEACALLVARLFKRRDAPFGLAGAPEIGVLQAIPRLDPDVRQLLDPYRRRLPVGEAV